MAAGQTTTHFGEHFTLDGYGGDPARLGDEAAIRAALTELCRQIGMNPLAPPLVVRAPGDQLKDPGGWSGVLLIVESHITVHTFPRRRFLTADVYSCRNGMDVHSIKAFLTERFALQDVETHFLRRGLRYPTHNLV
jgi:S-adenosylmethionine decarboxylase